MDTVDYRQPEGPLFDRKERLLVVENISDPDHKNHKANFVKHVVALANYARLVGRPAALVFGATDVKSGEVEPTAGTGVLAQSAVSSKVVAWPKRDDPQFSVFWDQHVYQPYKKIMREYIGPHRRDANGLTPTLDAEPIQHWDGNALLVVIEIRPVRTKEPFKVLHKESLGLPFQYYLRVNDDSFGVNDDDIDWKLTRWTDEPALPRDEWTAYLTQLQKELNTRPDPDQPDSYYDLFVERYSNKCQLALSQVWQELTPKVGGGMRIVVLVGNPGAGKTEALKRHLSDLADRASQEMKNSPERFEPQSWIPVYVDIANYQAGIGVAEYAANALTHCLERAKKIAKVDPKLFVARRLRFVVALDGIDEMSRQQGDEKVAEIGGFWDVCAFSHHAASSRPSRVPPTWCHKHEAYRLLPLTASQIKEYLGICFTHSQLESFRVRSTLHDLGTLLETPRLLKCLPRDRPDELVNYGQALKLLYDGIWAEEERRSRVDPNIAKRKLQKYACSWAASGQAEIRVRHLPDDDEEVIERSINAGILMRTGRNEEKVRFAHDEYADLLIAEELIGTQQDVAGVAVPVENLALLNGLSQFPTRQPRVLRILANILPTDCDLSLPPWDAYIRLLDRPADLLRVIAERQAGMQSTEILDASLAALDGQVTEAETLAWLEVLLDDTLLDIPHSVITHCPAEYLCRLEAKILNKLSVWEDIALVTDAIRRLVGMHTPGSNEILRTMVIDWLHADHLTKVEGALTLVDETRAYWATDDLKQVIQSKPLYPLALRRQAFEAWDRLSTHYQSTFEIWTPPGTDQHSREREELERYLIEQERPSVELDSADSGNETEIGETEQHFRRLLESASDS